VSYKHRARHPRIISSLDKRNSRGKPGLVGYDVKILTVDHNGERVWTMPRTLHAKKFLCSFQKRVGYRIRYKKNNKIVIPSNLSILFQWMSKVVFRIFHQDVID
jgi:hypothetical protein